MPKKNQRWFTPKLKKDTDIEAYLFQLKINDTTSKKMQELCQMSVLPQQEINERQKILSYIHNRFQPYFPDCLLHIFGSSVNGFGTKGCDMDIMFLSFPGYAQLDFSEVDNYEYQPTLRDLAENPQFLPSLKFMSGEKLLRFLVRVLRGDKKHFKEIFYIPAKCPIVKFYISHKGYFQPCDLSLHHGLAIFNTDLLRFYSMLDSRIRPLTITLRFWAKHLKIIHQSGGFSSYAFSLLVIFFLQNVNEPILPPVVDLMSVAEKHIVDGWEVAFASKAKHNFIIRNTQSEEDLLKDFFRFYWNFDFARKIVCVRTGKALPLYNVRNSTDERIKNFKVGDVCVQDPFDLAHNVASSVQLHRIRFLKPYFFVAGKILSQKSQSDELRVKPEQTFNLLFQTKSYEKIIQQYFSFPGSDADSSFCMYPNFEIVAAIGDNFKTAWYKLASQAVRDILQHVLLIDCEVIDKNRTLRDSDYSELLLSIQCLVDNRVWKHRKGKREMPLDSYLQNFSNKVLREENAFSLYLIDSDPALQCPEPICVFLCECYKSKYGQIPCMWIVLTPLTSSSEFRTVKRELKNFIPPTVKKMLLSYE